MSKPLRCADCEHARANHRKAGGWHCLVPGCPCGQPGMRAGDARADGVGVVALTPERAREIQRELEGVEWAAGEVTQ